MPDFSALLRRPAGQGKLPILLPAADYPGIVGGFEFGESSKQKTPFVRFKVNLTDWPQEDVDEEAKAGIELGKRPQRVDFYLTEDAEYRLDNFLTSCGVDMEGRTYEETIPEAVGKEVVISIRHRSATDDTGRVFIDVTNIVGVEA